MSQLDQSEMQEQKPNKPHQTPHKRVKSIDTHNIKAFGYSKGDRARQAVAHQLNIEQIRLFQPETRTLTIEDPPLLVAVQGPPGCGKSLLIKCLVKRYTDQSITEINGPVTVVANRSQRITFVEVPNDINAMIDIAKVADIVLLLVNAEHNFEMETFEFLNLLLNHGFSKVIGVLTHLDQVDKSVAGQLKARFRKELGTQIKVYKLERLVNRKYEKKSIVGLGRLLSQNKVRVISFRKGRGYALCDRVEQGKNGVTLMYGYVRGNGLGPKQKVHVPGAGDFVLGPVTILEDPCPLAPKETSQRTLKNQERMLYAPMCQVGGLVMDEDATYVDLPRNRTHFTRADDPSLDVTPEEAQQLESEINVTHGVQIVREMQMKDDTSAPAKDDEMIQLFDGVMVKANEGAPEEEEAPGEDEDVDEESAEEEEEIEVDDEANEEEIPMGEIPAGKYVKMEIGGIPKEMFDIFDPNRPVIVGGLLEEEIGDEMSQSWVKIKRHRFYARKPKSQDPMVVTIGWRRFQVLPVFFNEERGGKLRFMKYMPDFLTCWATFYGPPSKVNVGVTALQYIKENLDSFRISATGATVAPMGDGNIVKKLRVCGHPKEIFQKTAMIEDMFTSDIEATQFVGGLVKTVSGIRGAIKKVDKNGVVRCTFEDTIKSSDIVFLNTWVKVVPRKFYTPINSLLSKEWDLVRTTAEMRQALDLRPEYKEDSVYREVERPEYKEQVLHVPKGLREQLPYAVKKQFEKKETKKAQILNEEEASILDMVKKTSQVFERKRQEKEKRQAAEKAAAEKARRAEEAAKMHKRTQRKQEFFKRNPSWVHKK